MEYQYIQADTMGVNLLLDARAAEGWRVHTFHRNHGASVVDILLERRTPFVAGNVDPEPSHD